MECVLSGNQIRNLSNAVHCLAKVAHSAEITLEAVPTMVMLRTLNAAKTAFLAITFKANFFDEYQLSVPAASCCIYVKAVLTVFRTPPGNMDTLTISLDGSDAPKIKWTIECLNGTRKTYWLTCIQDKEILSAQVDRSTFPSYLVVKPKDLGRLLGNFQSTLGEITLIATEPVSTPTANDSCPPEAKAVELRSFIDPTKAAAEGGHLHTQLWIDPAEELQQYAHQGEAIDCTFSIKELRAFMVFCEAVEADLRMYFDKAGAPVLFTPQFGITDTTRADFDAMLVVASMMESQLRPPESSQGAATQRNGARAAPSGAPQTQTQPMGSAQTAPSAAPPAHRHPDSVGASDRTNIWSELSGSAARQSAHGTAPGGSQLPPMPESCPLPDSNPHPESADATEEVPRGGLRAQGKGASQASPTQQQATPRRWQEGTPPAAVAQDTRLPAPAAGNMEEEGREQGGDAEANQEPGPQVGMRFYPLAKGVPQASSNPRIEICHEDLQRPLPQDQPQPPIMYRNPNIWVSNSMDDDEDDEGEFVQATLPEKRGRLSF